MRHARSLRFEVLEARKLLSKAHVAVAHSTPAADVTPLVLDGTLAVDNNAAATTMNADGSSTTSVPVAGRLGTLGEVRGVWNQTVDEYGDSTGLGVLRLHDSMGTFIVAVDTENSGPAHPAAHGAVSYQYAQRLDGGTGAYTRASESGSIEAFTNRGQTAVESMTLHSRT
jgi:hypothetical protein